MSNNPSHPIWNIGLFIRKGNVGECIVCRENGTTKFEYKLTDSSVNALVVHLQSKFHKNTPYEHEYNKLKDLKTKQSTNEGDITKHLNITSSGIFIISVYIILFLLT